jgi:hypothetical protein
MWEESYALEYIPHAPSQDYGILMHNVAAIHLDAAFSGLHQAVDHFEGGGFAAPGGTKKNQRLSIVHLESNPLYGIRKPPIKGLAHVNEFNHILAPGGFKNLLSVCMLCGISVS